VRVPNLRAPDCSSSDVILNHRQRPVKRFEPKPLPCDLHERASDRSVRDRRGRPRCDQSSTLVLRGRRAAATTLSVVRHTKHRSSLDPVRAARSTGRDQLCCAVVRLIPSRCCRCRHRGRSKGVDVVVTLAVRPRASGRSRDTWSPSERERRSRPGVKAPAALCGSLPRSPRLLHFAQSSTQSRRQIAIDSRVHGRRGSSVGSVSCAWTSQPPCTGRPW
jgi:hypothetical protein